MKNFNTSNFDLDKFLENGFFIANFNSNEVYYSDSFSLKNLSHTPKNQNSFIYLNNFFLKNKQKYFDFGSTKTCVVNKFFEYFTCKKNSNKLNFQSPDKQVYENYFNYIKNKIDCFQIEKAICFSYAQSEGNLTKDLIQTLISKLSKFIGSKNVYGYGFWDLESNVFQIGLTPELIFLKQGKELETFALAGTVWNDAYDLENKKIQNEFDFVENDLIKQLNLLGKIKIEAFQNYKFANYFHKFSKIKVCLQQNSADFEKLLKIIHPSPALGVSPRSKGTDLLEAFESESNIDRGYYAGILGIQLSDEYSLCIACIRGLSWSNGMFRITAGGGVVIDSKFDEEWNEIRIKINSVKNIFCLEDKRESVNEYS